MAKSTLQEVFNIVKKKIVEKNISIEELSLNVGCDEKLIEIFLNPDNDVISSLSRMMALTKVNLKYNNCDFNIYLTYDSGSEIKITRRIKPRCHIYFDMATQEFYDFGVKYKKTFPYEYKDIYISEMAKHLKEYLENKKAHY